MFKSGQLFEHIESLQARIESLEEQLESKRNDITLLKDSLEASKRNIEEKLAFNTIAYDHLNNQLEQSEIPQNNSIRFTLPNFMTFMSYFKGYLKDLEPKFCLTKNKYADMVIGIPTIKREKTSYLIETLKSLFDALEGSDKSKILVVVLIAEVKLTKIIFRKIKNYLLLFPFEID